MPPGGVALTKLFEKKGFAFDVDAAHARLEPIAQSEGLPFHPPQVTHNSRLAQELASWADTTPLGAALHQALFAAHWVEGKGIDEISTLVEISRNVGLNENEATQVLTNRTFRTHVDADWHRCEDLGVTGVPTFVCNNLGVVGAQPYEVLCQLVEKAGVKKKPGL